MVKDLFKRNTHNVFFKALAGFGRSMNRLYENRNHNILTNGELVVLRKLSKQNPEVIIDGGANVGHYSLHVNSICKNSRLFCFEPVKSTFNQLKVNLGAYENIALINKGLYSENCTKEINLYPSHTHSSLYPIDGLAYDPVDSVEIELTKGDDFFSKSGIKEIDFLKLDLEGAEYDALVGFSQTLKKGNIKMIQFEYGYINITTKHLLIDFYHLLDKYGYVIGKVFPKTVEFRDYEIKYEDFLGPNFVAVKKEETELIQLLKSK